MAVGSTVLFQPNPPSRARAVGVIVEDMGEELVIECAGKHYRTEASRTLGVAE